MYVRQSQNPFKPLEASLSNSMVLKGTQEYSRVLQATDEYSMKLGTMCYSRVLQGTPGTQAKSSSENQEAEASKALEYLLCSTRNNRVEIAGDILMKIH